MIKNSNVLHLVEYLYLGGIERLLEQLADKTGNKANLHFFSYETKDLSGIGKQIQDKGHPVFTYKKGPGRDWKLVKEISRVIKENNIDVIHTHDFGPIEYAVILKLRFPSLRLIHTQHTVIHFVRHKKYTRFFQVASYFYKTMIAVSEFVKDTILEHCPLMHKSALKVIPNGVDTNVFTPHELFLDRSRLNMVSVARISYEKNLDYLLNTCRLLKNEGIPFIFHHAGTAKAQEIIDRVNKYITDHGMENCIIMHGFTNTPIDVLDLGDIFLSASITEGHPVALLEAMALEKVCFCSDIPPHREINNGGIELFDLSNEQSLYRLLVDYYRAKPVIQEKIHMARKMIVENFSLDKMIDSYVEQYK